MSGEAFDCVERHIYDIIERVEREIERATCERPPLVTETGVLVKERISKGHWRYDMRHQFHQFRSIESVKKYFRKIGCKVLEDVTRDGERYILMEDVVTKQVFCINTYTNTYYAPDENGEEPYFPDYTEETLAEFRRGIKVLKQAYIYAHRMAYLISCDDGEKEFHEQLKEELKELEEEE